MTREKEPQPTSVDSKESEASDASKTSEQCSLCQKKEVISAFRPFCSKKCKMIDLYKWVSGHYVIPGDPAEVLRKEEKEAKEEWENAWKEDRF